VQSDPSQTEELKIMVSAFKDRRDMLLEMMKEIPCMKTNLPQGAFYVFPEINELYGKRNGSWTINSSDDFCSYLLNNYYVALVPGTAFGSPECVRISYATSKKKLVEGMLRIKNAISELS
jgi:aspartate aminotransferase